MEFAFDLVKSCGDATCTYSVSFEQGATLKDLIDYILVRGERGNVYKGYSLTKLLEYFKTGQIVYDEKNWADQLLQREIAEIGASGGWGAMDYYVIFKPYKVKVRRIKNGKRV